ncbi:MAG TPA: hypothetical protein VIN34_07455, partial [Candidatus Limnocylindria bacterium]
MTVASFFTALSATTPRAAAAPPLPSGAAEAGAVGPATLGPFGPVAPVAPLAAVGPVAPVAPVGPAEGPARPVFTIVADCRWSTLMSLAVPGDAIVCAVLPRVVVSFARPTAQGELGAAVLVPVSAFGAPALPTGEGTGVTSSASVGRRLGDAVEGGVDAELRTATDGEAVAAGAFDGVADSDGLGTTVALGAASGAAVAPDGALAPDRASAAPSFTIERVVVEVTVTGASFLPPTVTATVAVSLTLFCATTPVAVAGPEPAPVASAAPLAPVASPDSVSVERLRLSATADPWPPPVRTCVLCEFERAVPLMTPVVMTLPVVPGAAAAALGGVQDAAGGVTAVTAPVAEPGPVWLRDATVGSPQPAGTGDGLA